MVVHDVQGGGGTDYVLDLKLNNERLENPITGAVVHAERAASDVKLHTISKDEKKLFSSCVTLFVPVHSNWTLWSQAGLHLDWPCSQLILR